MPVDFDGEPLRERNTCKGWISVRDNIKMGLNEIGWKGLGRDQFGPGWGQVARCCEHGMDVSVPKNSRNF